MDFFVACLEVWLFFAIVLKRSECRPRTLATSGSAVDGARALVRPKPRSLIEAGEERFGTRQKVFWLA
jgi:hypothetical protein